jgi:hypothetical protein
MKRITSVFLLASLAFAGCSKQDETPETRLNETIPVDSVAGNTARFSGKFSNGPYGSVSGDVKIYFQDGRDVLALENIAVSNGPDLHVYLSQEIQPVNFIDLGKLKSTNGNQLYTVNGTTDFNVYKYALIHCEQYNHLFGSAELK